MTHILTAYVLPVLLGVLVGWALYELGRMDGYEKGFEAGEAEGYELGRLSLLSDPLDNSGDQIAQLSREAYMEILNEPRLSETAKRNILQWMQREDEKLWRAVEEAVNEHQRGEST